MLRPAAPMRSSRSRRTASVTERGFGVNATIVISALGSLGEPELRDCH
jgi:hypothetical protein